MHTRDRRHTGRNLIVFCLSVLGLAALARIVEPFTVSPGAEGVIGMILVFTAGTWLHQQRRKAKQEEM